MFENHRKLIEAVQVDSVLPELKEAKKAKKPTKGWTAEGKKLWALLKKIEEASFDLYDGAGDGLDSEEMDAKSYDLHQDAEMLIADMMDQLKKLDVGARKNLLGSEKSRTVIGQKMVQSLAALYVLFGEIDAFRV